MPVCSQIRFLSKKKKIVYNIKKQQLSVKLNWVGYDNNFLRRKDIFNHEREGDAGPEDSENTAIPFHSTVTPSGPED